MGLHLYLCRVFSKVVGCRGGGGFSPTLRHDWCGNGLLVLPHVVEIAMESHPSTSEGKGWVTELSSD